VRYCDFRVTNLTDGGLLHLRQLPILEVFHTVHAVYTLCDEKFVEMCTCALRLYEKHENFCSGKSGFSLCPLGSKPLWFASDGCGDLLCGRSPKAGHVGCDGYECYRAVARERFVQSASGVCVAVSRAAFKSGVSSPALWDSSCHGATCVWRP